MIEPQHKTRSGIHYTTEGDGPALLFIHGAGGNAAVWFQQAEAFANSHKVIGIDLPGFGLSPAADTPPSSADLGAVAIEVMDDAGIEHAALVAQSLGGWFALRTALAAPERIDRLLLSCTMAGVAHPPAMQAFTQALVKMGPAGLSSLVLTKDFEQRHADKTLLFRQISEFNPPVDLAASGRLFAPEMLVAKSELAALDCPVLMLSGGDDPIWPAISLAGIIQAFSDGKQVVMQGTGHSPYFEKPEEFNRILADFLGT